ncbi:MAG: Uma2 family endonuclease [Okeania sp. SIO2G4]|uniref:Uma2 family endonuclease n=1 Tax=unclassified Okeania TaxID=2634635 RepID=UPI0013B9D6A6|nr:MULTISPECIES: Uma2 family endonuclease [unclassified Okeania]NEP74985.1 Uma2 family endonuclease [Okeania sp. SIO2G5]NEP96665.1 Uma2 family endonuclease [Okeania sp. SIO2F5]NEQ93851.1 Uma2 family endonuclease [Okeania sp. SIO2G4]
MTIQLPLSQNNSEIVYPDSDGQPMADNTIQFRWITVIHYNLAWLFADNAEVFVAGDLLWYPVEGNNKLRQAPDVMVVFGVPKGDRGSYQQWKENNIAPQVVFEILSPGNTPKEMECKLLFYDRYGVEEYYVYDPQKNSLTGWLRSELFLDRIDEINGFVSPRLGIRFQLTTETLMLYRPDEQAFTDYIEVQQQLEATENRALEAENRALEAESRTTVAQEELQQEPQEKEIAQERAKRLEQLLREAGIDPESNG